MGMFSRASKKLEPKRSMIEKALDITFDRVVIDPAIVPSLERMAVERGISTTQLINVRLTAIVNAYNNHRTLNLQDPMPFGQYRGISVENMIRSDVRYVRWLFSESDIFDLDQEALDLIEELS